MDKEFTVIANVEEKEFAISKVEEILKTLPKGVKLNLIFSPYVEKGTITALHPEVLRPPEYWN